MSGGSFSGQHPDLGVLTAITLPATGTSTAGRQRDSADSDAAELEQWAPPNGVERTVGSVEAQQFLQALPRDGLLAVRHDSECSFAIYSMWSFRSVRRSGYSAVMTTCDAVPC